MKVPSAKAFSLVELLVALTILAEIATFAIPKILNSQQTSTYNASAKEAISTASAAFQQHQLSGKVTSSTKFGDLTQYMNYVKYDTVSQIDNTQGGTPSAGTHCSNYPCLRLHNGGVIMWDNGETFGGTATTNVISFMFDPDGKVTDGTANGPGHSVFFILYSNGRLTDEGSIAPTGYSSSYTWPRNTASVPPWFKW